MDRFKNNQYTKRGLKKPTKKKGGGGFGVEVITIYELEFAYQC